ncbi:MAG: hypothetical protein ABI426_04190 [Flavobacterium sp.]
MENFLRKIKVQDHITIELDISKTDFTKNFITRVDESDLSLFDSYFEEFSSSRNEYKGNIDDRTFELRRRKRFFDINPVYPLGEGKMIEKSGKLILEIDIKIFNKYRKPLYIFYGLFFIIPLGLMLYSMYNKKTHISLDKLSFIVTFMLVILGLIYFKLRRAVTRMKYELERDFHFWVK